MASFRQTKSDHGRVLCKVLINVLESGPPIKFHLIDNRGNKILLKCLQMLQT